jgi:hypothetical protein
MDFVLTLCDAGDGEVCPDLGDRPMTAVWPFPDPARFRGSDIERTTLLNELYGMIRRRLEGFTNLPFATLDRMALKARLDELGKPSTYALYGKDHASRHQRFGSYGAFGLARCYGRTVSTE